MVIHLALHQWVRGSILAMGCMCKWFPNPYSLSQVFSGMSTCFQNWCAHVHYIKTPLHPGVLGSCCVKKGMLQSTDRIVAPYGLHAYVKRHDSDDSPVAAKLQRFGSFWRKALYKYGY